AALDQDVRVESLDLPGDPQRQIGAALAADRAEHGDAAGQRLPEPLGTDAVGCDDAQAGHHGPPTGRGRSGPGHGSLRSAPASTTADWKPPKPLPTDSTVRSRPARAVRGT